MKTRYKILPYEEGVYFVEKKKGLSGSWQTVRSFCPWRERESGRFVVTTFSKVCFESIEEAYKVIEEDKEAERILNEEMKKKTDFRRKNPPIYVC